MPKIVATNKRARFDYQILETFKAGLVLTGPEVKSIKSGQVNLKDSYATFNQQGELWLTNCYIGPYPYASQKDYDPQRSRKLLLTKKELKFLIGKLKERGLTLIPLEIFLERDLIKVKLGLAKGKKLYNKKELIKKKEEERKIQKMLKGLKK